MERVELVPVSDEVRADSFVLHVHNGKEIVPLFPGVTVYKNPLGGTTIVFCGTPRARFSLQEAFSFLNEQRKGQLMRLLRDAGEAPVCYAGDAEVYCRCADIGDTGAVFASFINVGLDQLDEIELSTEKTPASVERLSPAGEWIPQDFTVTDEGCVLTLTLPVLDCLALRMRF
jgi:hypothetical protein